jgi:hypothetical protein
VTKTTSITPPLAAMAISARQNVKTIYTLLSDLIHFKERFFPRLWPFALNGLVWHI